MSGSVPRIPGLKAEGELANEMRREVAALLGRNNTNFPGAQPVSFARHHFQELEERDYYLCEKTDGIRCLLYCTHGDSPDHEVHYLIDRKNDYYYVEGMHFPHHEDRSLRRFHDNTLIDGELVNDTMPDGSKRLHYLIFDCLVIDGQNVMQKPLDKRIGRINAWFIEPYKKLFQVEAFAEDVAQMPFRVMMKTMDKPYGTQMMFLEKLPNLPHGNDGLVFTCRDTPYVHGTDEHILKWKPPHENTIDFVLHLGEFPMIDPEDGQEGLIEDYDAKPTFQLLVNHGEGGYQPFADLYVTDEEWECMKRRAELEQLPLDHRIIECYKDEEKRWRYKAERDGAPRYRDDKPDANHISTVMKVIQSIEDAVTEQDLINAALPISQAWKRRHPEEDAAKRRGQGPPAGMVNGHHPRPGP